MTICADAYIVKPMVLKKPLHQLNDDALDLVAERFKALADPSRLRLLMCISNTEKSVGELVEKTGLSQANVSRHLQTLSRAGLISRRKDKLNVYYQICDSCIPQLCELMCGGLKKKLESGARIFK